MVCSYCGHITDVGTNDLEVKRQAAIDHILICEKRPENQLIDKCMDLKRQLADLCSVMPCGHPKLLRMPATKLCEDADCPEATMLHEHATGEFYCQFCREKQEAVRKARLEEAEWWEFRLRGCENCQTCETEQRIRALREQEGT